MESGCGDPGLEQLSAEAFGGEDEDAPREDTLITGEIGYDDPRVEQLSSKVSSGEDEDALRVNKHLPRENGCDDSGRLGDSGEVDKSFLWQRPQQRGKK